MLILLHKFGSKGLLSVLHVLVSRAICTARSYWWMLSKCKENRNHSAGSAGSLKRIWKPFSGTNELKKCSGFRATQRFCTVYIGFFLCVFLCVCVGGGGVQTYYSKKKVNIWHQEFLKELNINLKTLIKDGHFVFLPLSHSRCRSKMLPNTSSSIC